MNISKASKINLHPTSNHLICRRYDPADREGNIVLPESAQKQSPRALVIAAGPGLRLSDGTVTPNTIKVGDVVIIRVSQGVFYFDEGGEKLVICSEGDVVAVDKKAVK